MGNHLAAMQLRVAILACVVASAAAFSAGPALPLRATQRAAISQAPRMAYSPVPTPEGTKETYWETKAPSSDVLGIGKGVSSGSFAAFCVGQVIPLTDHPNPLFIVGSIGLPYSWALHV